MGIEIWTLIPFHHHTLLFLEPVGVGSDHEPSDTFNSSDSSDETLAPIESEVIDIFFG